MAPTWFKQCFWTLAGTGAVYVLGILALTIPVVQRNATYAHNVNPARWQNLSDVEQFGFIHHQVQPFTIQSTDNVTLHAWHILPTHLYRKHRHELTSQLDFGLKPFQEAASSVGLQLLLNDPSAIAMVSFHGNAAHLGSSYRPATYQQILSTSTGERPVHVIAFDYRGFGWSTGSPTEQGVIDDGIAVLSALCQTSSGQNRIRENNFSGALKPSQLVLVGQSLGTFVSTATLHEWAIKLGHEPVKALVLLASFSSLPKLLDSYSIKGLTPPILSPLTHYPWLQSWLRGRIQDKWDTAMRLTNLLRTDNLSLDITMMHAKDDWEIPYREGYENWLMIEREVNGTGVTTSSHDDWLHPELVKTWTSENGLRRVRWQKIRHGGHNRIPTGEHVKVLLSEILEH